MQYLTLASCATYMDDSAGNRYNSGADIEQALMRAERKHGAAAMQAAENELAKFAGSYKHGLAWAAGQWHLVNYEAPPISDTLNAVLETIYGE